MNSADRKVTEDWFRLKHRIIDSRVNEDRNSAQTPTNSPAQSRPVAKPVNHDGMDLNDLPPLREAVLAEAQLAELFDDIIAFGTDVRLQIDKPSDNVSLREQMEAARLLLQDGQVKRLQIRYSWQKSFWIDTLDRVENGFRLIRIMHNRSFG